MESLRWSILFLYTPEYPENDKLWGRCPISAVEWSINNVKRHGPWRCKVIGELYDGWMVLPSQGTTLTAVRV